MRCSRRDATLAAALVAAASTPSKQPAVAWCGGYYPGKISNNWDELLVPWSMDSYSTEIFCRIVKPPRRRAYGSSATTFSELPNLPAVLVVGCPGVAHDYLENLEGLVVSGRQVIAVDTCEAPIDRVSRSWMPPSAPPGPRAMRRPVIAAAQLQAVCEALQLEAMHVFAHGLGGTAALHLVRNLPASMRLASLTLASPYGALGDLRLTAQRRLTGVDEEVPLDFDGSDGQQPTEGQQCVTEASLLTGQPWREALLRATAAESEAERTGGSALASRLPPPTVPILLVRGGSGDPVEPSWDLDSRPDVRTIEYPFSSHLPFLDRREEFLLDLLQFFDRVDGVQTPRAGLSDGRG